MRRRRGLGDLGDERFEQELGPLRPRVLEHRLHRVEPLGGFLRVDVLRQASVPAGQHVGANVHQRSPGDASEE